MIAPEKLQTPEKPLDSGEASIYVLVSLGREPGLHCINE